MFNSVYCLILPDNFDIKDTIDTAIIHTIVIHTQIGTFLPVIMTYKNGAIKENPHTSNQAAILLNRLSLIERTNL